MLTKTYNQTNRDILLRSALVNLDAHLSAEVAALFIDNPLEIVSPDILAGEFNYGLTTDTIAALSSLEMSTYSIG